MWLILYYSLGTIFSLYDTAGVKDNITATKNVMIRLANDSAILTKLCISVP